MESPITSWGIPPWRHEGVRVFKYFPVIWPIRAFCNPIRIKEVTSLLDCTKAHFSKPEMCLCSLCDKTFSSKSRLKRHHESVHQQSVGFFYQVCSKHFNRKDVLRNHMKTHQPTVPVAPPSAEPEDVSHTWFKVAQNSSQHFPRRRFWCVIITTHYQLMLQAS